MDNLTISNTVITSQRGGLLISMIILLPVIAVIAALVENSLAVLVFTFLWLFLGILIINISFPKINRNRSYKLYLLFFAIYYLFMLVTNYAYVSDPYQDFFYHIDSRNFYGDIDSILQYDSGSEMYDRVLTVSRHWKGFGIISWFTGRVAYLIGEVNNIIIQKLQVVFLASMTVVFLYNMSRIHLGHIQSWAIAVSFGLLTHVFVFSGVLSRDLHITFLYTAGFYIVLSKWSVRNLIILILLCFLAWQFRMQHGIFFITFIGVYMFLHIRNYRNKMASVFLAAVFIISALSFAVFNFESYRKSTLGEIEHYQEYHEEMRAEATGLTANINRFPAAVRPVFNIIISQIYPYPVYRGLYVGPINEYQYLKFPLCIAEVYWILVWGVLFYGVFQKKMRKAIPLNVKYILMLAILLIIAAGSASYELRRVMCVYPAVYLSAALIYYQLDKRKRQIVVRRVGLFYAGTLFVYIVLKGF